MNTGLKITFLALNCLVHGVVIRCFSARNDRVFTGRVRLIA